MGTGTGLYRRQAREYQGTDQATAINRRLTKRDGSHDPKQQGIGWAGKNQSKVDPLVHQNEKPINPNVSDDIEVNLKTVTNVLPN